MTDHLTIPPGHCGTVELAKVLNLSRSTVSNLKKRAGFPEPAGRYLAHGYETRFFPFYNLRAVQMFVAQQKLRQLKQPNYKVVKRNPPAWAIPQHTSQQTRHCQITRLALGAIGVARGL